MAPGGAGGLGGVLATGLRAAMNRARRGLYAGKEVLFGNKVSEDGGNKSRRRWLPNVQSKRLFSELLGRRVRLRVTTHALRTIDKLGGLDPYLLQAKPAHLASDAGNAVRQELLKVLAARATAARAAAADPAGPAGAAGAGPAGTGGAAAAAGGDTADRAAKAIAGLSAQAAKAKAAPAAAGAAAAAGAMAEGGR